MPEGKMEACGTTKKLKFNRQKLIGTGSVGTRVYEGIYYGEGVYEGVFESSQPVAIKRILTDTFIETDDAIQVEPSDVNEAKLLRKFNHPNVIRYYLSDFDENFRYIALELCIGCLVDYVEKTRSEKTNKLMFPEDLYGDREKEFKKVVLREVVLGLDYLHDENIIHGDLKPQNILLKSDNHGFKFKAVLSDFGLSLELDYDRKSKTAHENKIGSEGWRAKEVLQMLEVHAKSKVKGAKVKGTKPIDVFAFGCIVQYVMTERTEEYLKHPFGEDIFRSRNVKADKRVAYLAKRLRNCLDDVLGDMLIGLCINGDAAIRLTTKEIKKHPFFWENSTQIQFIERVFNDIKPLSEDSEFRTYLEVKWAEYHEGSFSEEIPEVCAYYVARSRNKNNYINTTSVYNLLRSIRNFRQHYGDIENDADPQNYANLRVVLGQGNDNDFVEYFFQRILQVLPIVYLCFYKHPKITDTAYQSYYCIDEESSTVMDGRLECVWGTLDQIFNYSGPANKKTKYTNN